MMHTTIPSSTGVALLSSSNIAADATAQHKAAANSKTKAADHRAYKGKTLNR
jgi:hypothetical protein